MPRTVAVVDTRKRRLAPLLAAGAALAVCLLAPRPAQATASLFTNTGSICTAVTGSRCWRAGDFGVLVGQYNAVTTTWTQVTASYTGNADVNGEIGVGSGSKIITSGNVTNDVKWDGPIDFADALSGTATGTCGATGSAACAVASGTVLQSSTQRKTRIVGGTTQELSEIQTAMDKMRQISAYWSAQAPDAAWASVANLGSGTNSFSGTGIHVINVDASALVSTSADITITGDATSLFIFNIRSSSSATVNGNAIPVQFKNNITLSGINSDQVFFNILGSATGTANYVMQANTSGTTLNGVFYIAQDTYNVSTTFGGTGTGQGARLFGGSGNVTWGTNFVLNAPPDVSAVPEPSTFVLLGAGLCAVVCRRRHSARRAE
jgi:hypothetical protein